MKQNLLLLATLCLSIPAFAQQPDPNTQTHKHINTLHSSLFTLHYSQPATLWTEALPIGNGTIGAMVFGGVSDELIQLNEATLWSGGPVHPKVNPTAFEFLAQSREALAKEDYAQANKLVRNMQGLYTESYMPLGDLTLHQTFSSPPTAADSTNYYRDLNIQDGIATTTFAVNGVLYKRQIFASEPGQAIIIRLSSNSPKQITLKVNTGSQLPYKKSTTSNTLILNGKAPSHVDPSYLGNNPKAIIREDSSGCRGMRFELLVKPIIKDGSYITDTSGVTINNASEVILIITAATSFNGFDHCPDKDGIDEHQLALNRLQQSDKKSFKTLLNDHLTDFHNFFNRVSLTLNPNDQNKSDLPTDERLAQYTKGSPDPALEALYFQYGRYLILSASRTKGAPANLQGIWNKELRPPWSANYTTNINLQMNYWHVEATNLSEMFSPMYDLIKNLSVTGKETAESYYHAKGWVVHHNADLWATSNPVGNLGKGDPTWANWYMGANWLSRHLWEHYQFTGDKQFLQEAYPLMKGAAQFTLDWLIKDKNGYFVTSPSTSPENTFYYDSKKEGNVSVASTMDMGIIKDLFTNTIAATEVLASDLPFRDTLIQTKKQLFPFQIGANGRLQEWYKDFQDVDPHHRHTSHLYALHPAHEISPLTTPDFANAAKRTLELRGDDGTGWSLAWKVNMWARLLDGNHAYTLFKNLLRITKEKGERYGGGGGAYPNLFDAHPPFQIDGNFAGTAGVAEMLLQSQNNEIHLLPALPDAWKEGTIKGLVARGNYIVNINWAAGKLTSAKILSRIGGSCTIRTNQPATIKSLNLQSQKSSIGYTMTFAAQKGKTYIIE